jgi:hypothetical protein
MYIDIRVLLHYCAQLNAVLFCIAHALLLSSWWCVIPSVTLLLHTQHTNKTISQAL